MRVATIYDIHANLPALDAVLESMRHANNEQIVAGGDVVPGPMPRETFRRLHSIDVPVHFILGNGDREVLSYMAGVETEWYRNAPETWRAPIRWTAEQFDQDHQEMLAGWPAAIRLKISGLGDVQFCHATPRNDTDVFTLDTPEVRLVPIFESVGVP